MSMILADLFIRKENITEGCILDSRFSYMMNNMKKKFFVLGAIVLLLALSATGVFAKHHFSKEENDFLILQKE